MQRSIDPRSDSPPATHQPSSHALDEQLARSNQQPPGIDSLRLGERVSLSLRPPRAGGRAQGSAREDTADIKRRLAQRFDPAQLLDELRLDHRRQGRGEMFFCPWHDNSRTMAANLFIGDGGVHIAHCFAGCPAHDAIDLIAQVRGCSAREAIREAARLAGSEPSRAPRRPRATGPGTFPPRDEVRAIWARCEPLSSDAILQGQLAAKSCKPDLLELFDLARVIPGALRLPAWAGSRGGRWSETGHRLVLPVWSVDGSLVSLHARKFTGPADDKARSPRGCRISGAVFTNDIGRALLSGRWDGEELAPGQAPTWWRRREVRIFEGASDFLAGATAFGDAQADVPAVLGVIAGSWTEAIARRIPPGSAVSILTDPDTAGANYAWRIASSLVGRCDVRVRREHRDAWGAKRLAALEAQAKGGGHVAG